MHFLTIFILAYQITNGIFHITKKNFYNLYTLNSLISSTQFNLCLHFSFFLDSKKFFIFIFLRVWTFLFIFFMHLDFKIQTRRLGCSPFRQRWRAESIRCKQEKSCQLMVFTRVTRQQDGFLTAISPSIRMPRSFHFLQKGILPSPAWEVDAWEPASWELRIMWLTIHVKASLTWFPFSPVVHSCSLSP